MSAKSFALMALVLVASTHGLSVKVTPVEKVIQLLEGMKAKGETEKHEEQVQYAAYKQFCDDTSVEKQRAIKEANQAIEQLNADIQDSEATAARLTKEIAAHDKDIATWESDKKAATDVRGQEKTDYVATHKDYSESVDALERAIAVLKKEAYDRPQAAALLTQLSSSAVMPDEAKKVIAAFLATGFELGQDPLDVTAPEANAYEFQSQSVIDMLEKLHDKFVDERTQLEKDETNAQHAYEMLMQDLTGEVNVATDARNSKSENKANKLQAAAQAKGDLADTTATRDEDSKYLSDLTATCAQKSDDFENRQKLRTDELAAIAKAIEILGSDKVAGNAKTYLPTMLQVRKSSFLQMTSSVVSPAQSRVAAYLQKEGEKIHSRVLSALAVRVAEDPFKKVKEMIQDLIVRLMEEANEEAEHKGWCDTELAKNEATRKEKTSAVETLHAEIDELDASIAKLGEQITTLTQEVADIDGTVANATKIREAEKAENEQTIKDAGEAQTAVAQALTVLKEFYAAAAQATSFVQQQPEAPEIFDAPYTGMQAENGGVIGMLEVIQSDFARLETETKSAEDQAQKEYDTLMTESAVDKASKTKDIEHKTLKKQNQASALNTKKEDLAGTQKELDAALLTYDKLKPSCVDAGVTYEDRVGRREEEIQSLQEALRILNGEDLA